MYIRFKTILYTTQLIGQASGAISANVYSSICGTVTAIEDIVNGCGQKMKYVVIENVGDLK